MFGGLISSALSAGLNSGGGGDNDDDWMPPVGWIDIPEPEAYQITMLVDTSISQYSIALQLTNDKGGTGNSGKPFVDWGDGTITQFIEGVSYTASHTYEEIGQYIITINGVENENFFNPQNSYGWGIVLAMKYGISMGVYTNALTRCGNLVYIKFKGKPLHFQDRFSFAGLQALTQIDFEGDYPDDEDFSGKEASFNGCMSLKKAPFTKNLTIIHPGMFQRCYSLKEIDLTSAVTIDNVVFTDCRNLKNINAPLLETLGNTCFSGCTALRSFSAPELKSITSDFQQAYSLKEVNTPSLISAASGAFVDCYNLQKFTYAEGCNFNGNTFSTCLQLYPKPQ